MKNISREIREVKIFNCARSLRQTYKKDSAVGFCYGGWAVFRLSSKEHQLALVGCMTAEHPSLLTMRRSGSVWLC